MPSVSSQSDYIDDIRHLCGAEQPLGDVLTRMARTASAPFLRELLHRHGRMAEIHLRRLEWICRGLRVQSPIHASASMRNLTGRVEGLLASDLIRPDLDAALAAAAQAISQHKVMRYATARFQATRLGHLSHAALLEQSLNEEVSVRDAVATALGRPSNGEAKPLVTWYAELPVARRNPADPRDLDPTDRPDRRPEDEPVTPETEPDDVTHPGRREDPEPGRVPEPDRSDPETAAVLVGR